MTLLGEVFGTAVIGGLCAYPVAVLLMGQSVADVAFLCVHNSFLDFYGGRQSFGCDFNCAPRKPGF